MSVDPDLLAAVIERLIPADEHGPGGREAGVDRYILRALETGYAAHRGAYAEALDTLAARGFALLEGEHQDALLAALERDSPAFFDTLLGHAREGMFGDPAYGGNAGGAGWALLGYPGPRPGWTAAEQ